jgi:hypothetical protein
MTANFNCRRNHAAQAPIAGRPTYLKRIAVILTATALSCAISYGADTARRAAGDPYAPQYHRSAFNLGGSNQTAEGDSAFASAFRTAASGDSKNRLLIASVRNDNTIEPQPDVPTSTPEPGTIALLGVGFGAVALIRRRRQA